MNFASISIILQVVIVFGLIVFVHERSFLAAKWQASELNGSLGLVQNSARGRDGVHGQCGSSGGYVKMVGEEVGEEVIRP